MNKIMVLLALVFPVVVLAQMDDGQKYANTITRDGLKKHLSIVAGTEMEGRETGTEGQRKAAGYIESQFRQLGLQVPPGQNGYQQQYSIFKDTLLLATLRVGRKNYAFGKDFIVSTQNDKDGEIKARQLVFVGYGITALNYDDYAGKDVKGKVVVFFTGEPRTNGKYLISGNSNPGPWSFPGTITKVINARQKGAVAALVINPVADTFSTASLENARKTNLYFPHITKEAGRVNYAVLSKNMASDILGDVFFSKALQKAKAGEVLNGMNKTVNGKSKFEFKKLQLPSASSNVIGYVEGSDKKDETIFLTGHYDHLGKRGNVIYYGADDDGSGTVSVIEMAEAFVKAKSEGHGPRRSVVFMTVSGEEKGLWGSEYYSDHPLFPLDKTSADLNTDMVGRIDPNRKNGDSMNYVYVIGDDKLSSDLKPISIGTNAKYTNLELDYKFNDPSDPERIYYRSDHYNFARKGIPIIFYFDGIHKDYHKPSDTVDKINFDLMEKRVRFIFLTAWEIANRDAMLKRDIPLPTE
ncbi:MAG: M28 family peptidase [Ginsengibacter sp.]